MLLILPGLFLGSKVDAMDVNFLTENNITCILNVAKSTYSIYYDESLNIDVLKIPLIDHPSENIKIELDLGYSFINLSILQNRNILVHCVAGISRSSTFVLYYLMKKYNMNLTDALNFSRQKRQIIRPNSGFLKTLFESMN